MKRFSLELQVIDISSIEKIKIVILECKNEKYVLYLSQDNEWSNDFVPFEMSEPIQINKKRNFPLLEFKTITKKVNQKEVHSLTCNNQKIFMNKSISKIVFDDPHMKLLLTNGGKYVLKQEDKQVPKQVSEQVSEQDEHQEEDDEQQEEEQITKPNYERPFDEPEISLEEETNDESEKQETREEQEVEQEVEEEQQEEQETLGEQEVEKPKEDLNSIEFQNNKESIVEEVSAKKEVIQVLEPEQKTEEQKTEEQKTPEQKTEEKNIPIKQSETQKHQEQINPTNISNQPTQSSISYQDRVKNLMEEIEKEKILMKQQNITEQNSLSKQKNPEEPTFENILVDFVQFLGEEKKLKNIHEKIEHKMEKSESQDVEVKVKKPVSESNVNEKYKFTFSKIVYQNKPYNIPTLRLIPSPTLNATNLLSTPIPSQNQLPDAPVGIEMIDENQTYLVQMKHQKILVRKNGRQISFINLSNKQNVSNYNTDRIKWNSFDYVLFNNHTLMVPLVLHKVYDNQSGAELNYYLPKGL